MEWYIFIETAPYLIVCTAAGDEYDGSTRSLKTYVLVPPRSYPAIVEEEVLSPIVFIAFRYLDARSLGTSTVLTLHAPIFLARAFLPRIPLPPVESQVEI